MRVCCACSEAFPDRDVVPVGSSTSRRRRKAKGGGGQLVYQPLDHDHDHDAEGDEVLQSSPSGRNGNSSFSLVNANSGTREIRGADSGLPITRMVELAPVTSRSKKKNKYELLENDGADDGGTGVVKTRTDGMTGCGSASDVYGTPTGSRRGSSGGEEEGGRKISGQQGLLSTPNVNMILFIVAIVQVGLQKFVFPRFSCLFPKNAFLVGHAQARRSKMRCEVALYDCLSNETIGQAILTTLLRWACSTTCSPTRWEHLVGLLTL